MDSVEKLYKNYEILNDADSKASKCESEYLEILQAVKGSTNEKRLASQFIVRFFGHFPALSEQAIDAVMDLCEDDDVAIRKQAIKDLPHLCRENRSYLPKIADVLAQMLQSDDSSEVKEVYNSLCVLLKMDVKGCLYGLFSQIQCDEMEDGVRERTIKFLASKARSMGKDVFTADVEDILWSETKKSLKGVSGDEFVQLMEILASTQTGRTGGGQQKILRLIVEQLTNCSPGDVADETSQQQQADVDLSQPDVRNKLVSCARLACKLVSRTVKASEVFTFLVQKRLQQLDQLDDSYQLQLLQPLAEMAQCLDEQLDDAPQLCLLVFQQLISYMPLPPATSCDDTDDEQVSTPTLLFSHIECLLCVFHQLAQRAPAFLTAEEDRLADFRLRLQYVARGTQAYMRSLRESLKTSSCKESAADKTQSDNSNSQVLAAALRTTSNINKIIKDLFHTPPIYTSCVTLSWKQATVSGAEKESVGKTGERRRAPITFDSDSSAAKTKAANRPVYQPPGGKYSEQVAGYRDKQNGGGGVAGGYRNRQNGGGGGGGYRSRFRGNRRY